MSGAAARTSRTTRARPTATRMNTPRIRPQPPTGTVGGCEKDPLVKLDGPAAQPAPLPLREAAPDAEALVVGQRVLQALRLDLTPGADLLRLAGRAALLGKERLGVGLGAQRPLLPRLRVGLQADAHESRNALADAGTQSVGRPLGGTDVIAQPRNLGHDVASPLALAPVRGFRDDPGPLRTR